MNNYFGKMNRDAGSAEGCSASFPTSDGSQPSDPGQPKCKIYSNYNDEVSKQDSCTNIKEMDNLVCPVSNATKSVMSTQGPSGNIAPLILKCNYLPPNGKSNGLPVECIDDASIKRYLSVIPSPNITDDYTRRSVRFCRASKAYYIDGTLLVPPALDVPGSAPKATVCPPAPVCPSEATKEVKEYDNSKVYTVGDFVSYKGGIYKMVEAAGAAGYNPQRAGDKLWTKIR
jgi:hypothetical protein